MEGKKGITIAIDGPVASGKGTIAPLLAAKIRGFFLPTGVMYRCVTLYALRKKLLSDPRKLEATLPYLKIRIRDHTVYLNDEDVTEEIKRSEISQKTPLIAIIPEVRKVLIKQQQEIGKEYTTQGIHVVAEGRDIGTVVFPDAKIKLFLTASPAVRARRRLEQLHAQGEANASYPQVFEDTIARDNYDQEEVKTLVPDPKSEGYIVVDNSDFSEGETLDVILRLLKKEGIQYD